jgi:hypothetical protein
LSGFITWLDAEWRHHMAHCSGVFLQDCKKDLQSLALQACAYGLSRCHMLSGMNTTSHIPRKARRKTPAHPRIAVKKVEGGYFF